MIKKINEAVNTKNNGGTIKGNGSTLNKNFIKVIVNSRPESIFYNGSTVVLTNDTNKALSQGIFAKSTQSPIAKKVTNYINVVYNNYLVSGALKPNLIRSIKKAQICGLPSINGSVCQDGIRTRKVTTAIRNNKYNIFSGKFDQGFPEIQEDLFETDRAASVSRIDTGRLIYKKPIDVEIKNYSKKTG